MTSRDAAHGNEDRASYRCCEHCQHGKRSPLVNNHPKPCVFEDCWHGNTVSLDPRGRDLDKCPVCKCRPIIRDGGSLLCRHCRANET